jgi:trehalose 6-phosphate phosphatase
MYLPSMNLPLALFLDFDGCLAEVPARPEEMALPHGGREVLLRTALKVGGAIAIMSGREIGDLASRVPAGLWRVGSHGLDMCPPRCPVPPPRPAPRRLTDCASEVARRFPQVETEVRGPVLMLKAARPAIHDRLPDCAEAALNQLPGYHGRPAAEGIELAPLEMNTGAAVRTLMARRPFTGRLPVAVGMDGASEDAMLMCLQLGGYAIKVGAGATLAPVSVPGSAAVWQWLGGYSV